MNPQENYQAILVQLKKEHKELKKSDDLYVFIRLITGIAMVVCVFFALMYPSLILWMAFFSSLVLFVIMVVKHGRLRYRLRHTKALIRINQGELAYLDGDFSAFDAGNQFRDPSHLFAEDLDLFGDRSLFQRVNRSSTQKGREKLAKELAANDFSEVEFKQTGIHELSEMLHWRQNVLALSAQLDDQKTENDVRNWLNADQSAHWLLQKTYLWLFSLMFPVIALIILVSFGIQAADWLIYPFLINLFLFSRLLKPLKEDYAFVDKLAKDFDVYAKVIAQFEEVEWSSQLLRQSKQCLASDGVPAAAELKKLSTILNRLDSMNNAIGAILLNGLCFYHLHVYRDALSWKSKNADLMLVWLEELSLLEVRLSLANFYYNHPSFAFPELLDDQKFEAVQLGHPFINDGIRVCNDVSFESFNTMVLTGSNMAGKSTFLRSIGLAIVMTSAGLPVCADRLSLSPFKLLTSMKPQDSVNDNTSYFQAEINRLRAIVDELETGSSCFLLLDEILRGTNSQDKRNGTKAFLQRIKKFNMRGVIATHDVEIAELTDQYPDWFRNYFFESKQEGEALVFDYLLREGVCQTPNATQLMKNKGII